MKITRSILLAFAFSALVLMAVYLPLQDWLTALVEWSRFNPNLAVLGFSALIVLGMVLMFPVSVQAMAAGFIFGLGKGFMIMWLGGLLGFTVAFLVGRGLARPSVEQWVSSRPDFVVVEKAINQKGLVVVILARLAQILPYNMLNYAFGLTSVRLGDYALGSALGMIPGIFAFVFLGTTATDIASVMSGELKLGDYGLWLGAFGVLVTVFTVALIARIANRALREQLEGPG